MNLEQYAAQQAQAPQGAQSAPQAQEPLDVLAARLDAERLYSLMAEAQEAIDGETSPAAMLERITGALFGADSPQAAAVAQAIDADRHPGGHELSIADLRQQRALLRQQHKQLEAQAQAITGELEKLDAAERALTGDKAKAAALDRALLDVLTFTKAPQGDLLQQMAALYDRHHGSPAAMGLLYGVMCDLTRYSAGAFDLLQQQTFKELKDRVARAISGAETAL